ncbi:SsrA-binding protein SmpB [Desulfurispirillum indicum]|uniref:SsrA-binding protein SmpB n=1 Tax=Desulfurispirillum indicum TaxID=936456 RepID=UPI001CFAC105|nr:SsrA-binding protein SmpB [Desulfurispirillum indicum]UCZ55780.1 SsrA-binding protein SmpB [Desulfurispirillum indicum]
MGIKIISDNRSARHHFEILETLETGVVLKGSEVKSIRQGKVNLKDAYCRVDRGELFLFQCHISPYEEAGPMAPDPTRVRKLLAHKMEIDKLAAKAQQGGLAIVPTKMYFKNGKVKVEVALGKGKKLHDKRESLKQKDAQREAQQALKNHS